MRGIAVVGVPSTMLGRGSRHSLAGPGLLAAWYAGAVKRRDEKSLAELAELSQRHMIEREADRFDEHLTDDPRPAVEYAQVFDIAEGKRALASMVLRVAASDLGIDMPEMRWFRQAEDEQNPVFSSPPINGLADRETGVVWLLSQLSPLQVAATVAHEAAHLAGRGELDAQLYGAQYQMETE